MQNTYDELNRLVSAIKTVGSVTKTTAYGYDANGNQTTVTDWRGNISTNAYDPLNRLIKKLDPYTTIQILEYNRNNVQVKSYDALNNMTQYLYDRNSRLMKNVITGSSTVTYAYNLDGSKKSVTYPDASKEEYTYHADGLNKTLVNSKADGMVIDSYSYTYDAAHNQFTKADAKGVTGYAYDSLNRLEKITEPSGKVTNYTFDKAGNRETETVTAGTATVITTYSYNEQNRLLKTVAQSGGESVVEKYEYDNNGNTASKTKEVIKPVDPAVSGSFAFYKAGQSTAADVTLYEYDVWNQLVKTAAGDKTTTCQYNGDGLRIAKTVNGQTTKYLYESDRVILETDGAGTQTARNVYGTNLLSRVADNQIVYYMYNGHGDVTALLGTTGVILASYYYDAFGNITETAGSFNNPVRYAGYRYDGETGLYYLNARYYDSKVARFLTEDTYRGQANDPLSLNLLRIALTILLILLTRPGIKK